MNWKIALVALLPAAQVNAQCPTPSRPLSNALDGIWGGIESARIGSYGVRRVSMTFLPGGRVLMRQPPEGLMNPPKPTSAVNWQGDWGTYRVVNGREVQVTLPEGALSGCWDGRVLRLKRGTSTGIYRPWPRLAGVLTGTYRAGDGMPAISFDANGRFVDQGFQGSLGDLQAIDGGVRFSTDPEERQARAPGSGRYVLRDNTLELRYDDGRISRLTALVTPEDAAVTPLPRLTIGGQIHERVGN